MDTFIPAAPISPRRQRRPISKAWITAPTKPSLVPADPMGTAAKASKPASMPAAAQRPHSLPSAPRENERLLSRALANLLNDADGRTAGRPVFASNWPKGEWLLSDAISTKQPFSLAHRRGISFCLTMHADTDGGEAEADIAAQDCAVKGVF